MEKLLKKDYGCHGYVTRVLKLQSVDLVFYLIMKSYNDEKITSDFPVTEERDVIKTISRFFL